MSDRRTILCVDLDGTLLRTDLLHESLLLLVKQQPWALWRVPLWLMGGKARLKRELASRVEPDYATIPVHDDVLEYVEDARSAGRRLALVSASDQRLVEGIAAEFGPFDMVLGSDGETNLSGAAKLEAIRESIGEPFVYAADHPVDRHVWQGAQGAVLVGDVDRLARLIDPHVSVEARFPRQRQALDLWRRALRVHQWAKNLLVFVALVLAGPLVGIADWIDAGRAFLALGLLASAGYVWNDLLDLAADRAHPTKRTRPFASGELTIKEGAIAIPVLIGLGLALTIGLPLPAIGAALIYLVMTVAYSMALKRIPMVDVAVLAGLFTIRIFVGVSILEQPISFWLLTFSMFFFLSLAIVKRYAELRDLADRMGKQLVHRGYSVADLPILLSLGVSSAISACMLFVIYLINESFPQAIYGHPEWLWLIFPIMQLWIVRVWHLAVHGQMNQDPVAFALTDRVSYGMGAAVFVLLLLAW